MVLSTCLSVLLIALNPFLTDAGIFQNVYETLKDTGKFLINANNEFIRIARGIHNIHGVFDDATEEECIFECSDGKKPVKNKNHIARANGCGTFGFQLSDDQLPVAELSKCCNEHDICYDTCNNDKEDCDKKFRKCLFKICDNYKQIIGQNLLKGCKATAQAMYAGTMALGCKAYKDSQKMACYCKPRYDL